MFLRRDLMKRLFVLLGLVVGVFILVMNSPTEAQSVRPSRLSIEEIPYLAGEEKGTETIQTIQSPEILSWSKVAFQSYRDNNWNIYVGNDDGSGQARLTNYNAAEIQPHLNRGNSQIVYARKNGDYDIFKMNIDGSNQVALTVDGTDDGNPAWSPDGTKIVFESYRDGQAEIYVMNADGTGQTRLTAHGDFDGMPTWSPDGSKIAFVSRRTGGYRIWVMNANGTNPVQVSSQPYSLRPQWSPDGTQIAFDADSDGDGWQDLWRMYADGSGQVKVYDPYGTRDAWAGSWSPDGRYIAFTNITFIQHQGNWYWTYAYADAWDSQNNNTVRLSQNGLDWTPRWQTSDNIAPVVSVNNLPAESPGPVTVRWSGADPGGSGLVAYDVQVKVGANGTWTDWFTGTISTAANYPGTGGNAYYFRVRAHDRAFNTGNWPANYSTFTVVENYPPGSRVAPLAPFNRYDKDFAVNWYGSDPGYSGIASFDIQYRIGNGPWVDWKIGVSNRSASFGNVGNSGDILQFRSRSIDKAQNLEAWPAAVDASTQLYAWGIYGNAYDNTHTPVSNLNTQTVPALLGERSSDVDGRYGVYVAELAGTYSVDWYKNGYGSVPATMFPQGADVEKDIVVPPHDNLLENWGFEDETNTSWTLNGSSALPVAISDTVKHSGNNAIILGSETGTFGQSERISFVNGETYNYSFVVDSRGTLHVIWNELNVDDGYRRRLYYASRDRNGVWSPAEILNTSGYGIPRLLVDDNDTLHAAWRGPYYAQKPVGGTWSEPEFFEQYSSSNGDPEILLDDSGNVHAFYTTKGGYTKPQYSYRWRSVDGVWSQQKRFTHRGTNSNLVAAFDDSGNLHAVWLQGNDVFYIQKSGDGVWSEAKNVTEYLPGGSSYPNLVVEKDGTIHAAWIQHESGSYHIRHSLRDGVGNWKTSAPLFAGTTNLYDLDMGLSSDGQLHLIWTKGYRIYYSQTMSNGAWENEQIISTGSELFYPQLLIDANNLAHVIWGSRSTSSGDVSYIRQVEDGIWQSPLNLSNTSSGSQKPQLVMDKGGHIYAIWIDKASGDGDLYYAGPEFTSVGANGQVEQTFTIPVSMTNPILSFLHQTKGLYSVDSSKLSVAIQDEQATTELFAIADSSSQWRHSWFDLTDWAGEEVTLILRLDQEISSPEARVIIDEVSVGSTYPDIWLRLTDTNGAGGQDVIQSIIYGNRGGAIAEDVTISYTLPAGMSFVSASVPPASTNPLVWEVNDLIGKSDSFIIEIVAEIDSNAPGFTHLESTAVINTANTELELLNNQDTGNTFTAADIYLPTIFR